MSSTHARDPRDSRPGATRVATRVTSRAGARRRWTPIGLALGSLASGCGDDSSPALEALVARDWRARLANDPLFATSVGERARDDALPGVSRAALTSAAERARALLAELRALAPGGAGKPLAGLDVDEEDTLELLVREVEGRVLRFEFGELELRRLRADAEARLGARFDVRAFHDVVLGAGTVTLAVLAQRIEREVAAQR